MWVLRCCLFSLLFVFSLTVFHSNSFAQAKAKLPEGAKIEPCSPATMIDFERVADVANGGFREPIDNEVIGDEINDFFWSEYGIRFSAGTPTDPDSPRIGKIGTPLTGWLRDGTGQHDKVKRSHERYVGNYFLGVTYHLSSRPTLTIEYKSPVAQASAGIIDIDGGEVWEITAYNDLGVELESQTISSSSPNTANAEVTFWQFDRAQADISTIVLEGYKGGSKLGLGFDSFSPSAVCVP